MIGIIFILKNDLENPKKNREGEGAYGLTYVHKNVYN